MKNIPEGISLVLGTATVPPLAQLPTDMHATPLPYLSSLALDPQGNIYAVEPRSDFSRNPLSRLLKVNPQGSVTVVAEVPLMGGGTMADRGGVAVDRTGNVFVATGIGGRNCGFSFCDRSGTIIRVSPGGATTTLVFPTAGNALSPATDIVPNRITTDATGNLYVSSDRITDLVNWTYSTTITKFSPSGVRLWQSAAALSFLPGRTVELVADAAGNVFVGGNPIRKLTPEGVVSDVPGQTVFFGEIRGMAIDDAGNLYVAEYTNHVIRKVTPASVITTVVGTLGQERIDLGTLPGSIARPSGVAVDCAGTVLYVSSGNALLRVKLPQ